LPGLTDGWLVADVLILDFEQVLLLHSRDALARFALSELAAPSIMTCVPPSASSEESTIRTISPDV
jgi:hypothetical protein